MKKEWYKNSARGKFPLPGSRIFFHAAAVRQSGVYAGDSRRGDFFLKKKSPRAKKLVLLDQMIIGQEIPGQENAAGKGFGLLAHDEKGHPIYPRQFAQGIDQGIDH